MTPEDPAINPAQNPAMDSERWRRVKELFGTAVNHPTAEREAYVTWACGDDQDLRREVLSLLARDTGEDFIWDPVLKAARSVTTEPTDDLKRYSEAEEQLLAAYASLKATRGEQHEHTRKAVSYLIELYEAWGKPEKADSYRALPHAHQDKPINNSHD